MPSSSQSTSQDGQTPPGAAAAVPQPAPPAGGVDAARSSAGEPGSPSQAGRRGARNVTECGDFNFRFSSSPAHRDQRHGKGDPVLEALRKVERARTTGDLRAATWPKDMFQDSIANVYVYFGVRGSIRTPCAPFGLAWRVPWLASAAWDGWSGVQSRPCAQDMGNEMQVHAAVQTRLGEIVKAQGSHRDVANDPQFSLCRLLPTPFYTAMKATCLKNGWHLESMFLCVANALEPLRGARLVAVCPCRSSQPTSSSVGFWFR